MIITDADIWCVLKVCKKYLQMRMLNHPVTQNRVSIYHHEKLLIKNCQKKKKKELKHRMTLICHVTKYKDGSFKVTHLLSTVL
jgi:hypothetical protein